MTPYWSDDTCSLYLGDMREVLPALGITADLVVADPPYGETQLAWDRWPDGWLEAASTATASLWCFGSLRMFAARWASFTGAGWKHSHDVVWEKHTGSSFTRDRFRRVHEFAAHWYRARWAGVYHVVPTVARTGKDQSTRRVSSSGPQLGKTGREKPWCDDGTRLMRSVIYAKSLRGKAIHPTEKPTDLLTPLISYACPPGGLVIDPFAGSGSTLEAARLSGRRAIGIEADERYAELAARRLSQQPLEIA